MLPVAQSRKRDILKGWKLAYSFPKPHVADYTFQSADCLLVAEPHNTKTVEVMQSYLFHKNPKFLMRVVPVLCHRVLKRGNVLILDYVTAVFTLAHVQHTKTPIYRVGDSLEKP